MAGVDIDFRAAQLGIDWSQDYLDSILLPPGENFGIESDDEGVYHDDQLELEFDTGFGNIIVVDNLPVVTKTKFELETFLKKNYNKYGVIKENGLWMPVDPDTGVTLGYCFIEFNTPQEAQNAKEKTHAYKMTESHVLDVYMFDDFDRLMNVKEEWEAPDQAKPYVPGDNLQKWLTDEKARDQLVIRSGPDTEVLWNDPRQKNTEPVHKRPYWTESYVQWSPLGTYLVTLHKQGAAVWGGADTFTRLMRYQHSMVKLVDFSPGEKYLVTYHNQEPSNPRDASKVEIKVFDVRTGRMMRDFKGSADEFSIGGPGGVAGASCPVFRWGGGKDDKYFAKLRKNTISVYETETFGLIDKKSIKVDNVVDICWSPTDSILSLFVPEQSGGNQPAKVALVQIPSKVELRQKNLFSVSDCKMYWQSSGEYLAVKVDRYCTKTKKSTYSGFELFRIKERDIPIEVLELDNKNDKIIAFAWEPKGHRFAVIHGDQPRPDVSFYTMKTAQHGGRVTKLGTLKAKQANALFWSPTGKYIILAGLKNFNGQLEFFNVDEMETIATTEHFMATDVEWDPTGRYVATAVTSVHEMENGFTVWSFHGKLLYRVLKDHFFQLAWRPRPPSFLPPEKEEEIAKNLKTYRSKYEEEDQDLSLLLSEQEREKRNALKEEWEKWVMQWKLLHEEEKLERQNLRDGEISDEEGDDEEAKEVKEVEFEDVIDVTEEIVQE